MSLACDADILGWTTQFVARWSGGNKDLPAAVVTTSRQLFVAGSADGRGFSRVDGEAANSTWCAYIVSLTVEGGSHVEDSQLCTGGATWSRDAAATAEGDLWVVGGTDGARAPVTRDAYQQRYAGTAAIRGWGDALIFRRAGEGRLLYATYVGGSGDDVAHAIVADADSGTWFGGSTTSPRFIGGDALGDSRTTMDAYLAQLEGNGQARLLARLDHHHP